MNIDFLAAIKYNTTTLSHDFLFTKDQRNAIAFGIIIALNIILFHQMSKIKHP